MTNIKVVVLDDVFTMRTLVRKILEGRNPQPAIYEGKDGKEGLQLLKEHDPEIVFVDWQMPLMNGGEFLASARSQGYDGVIVVVTAEEKQTVEELLRTHDARYLRKPSGGEKVMAAFSKIVNQFTDGAAGRSLRRGKKLRSAV